MASGDSEVILSSSSHRELANHVSLELLARQRLEELRDSVWSIAQYAPQFRRIRSRRQVPLTIRDAGNL